MSRSVISPLSAKVTIVTDTFFFHAVHAPKFCVGRLEAPGVECIPGTHSPFSSRQSIWDECFGHPGGGLYAASYRPCTQYPEVKGIAQGPQIDEWKHDAGDVPSRSCSCVKLSPCQRSLIAHFCAHPDFRSCIIKITFWLQPLQRVSQRDPQRSGSVDCNPRLK